MPFAEVGKELVSTVFAPIPNEILPALPCATMRR